MNVVLTPQLEAQRDLAALARATSKLLTAIIGRAADDMMAEWDFHKGRSGEPGIAVTLTDMDGTGRATFTRGDFKDVNQVRARCRKLWEDMVEQSSKSEVIPKHRRG